tara:strand:+ start:1199 stop:2512 length:1314 start_codon:yes stop_codon:yes gene_type:complete
MINELKIVAVIPAKGSSERVQNKNLRLVDGEPLVLRAVRKCVQSKFFDEVWIDTESQEIIDLCEDYNCKVMKRHTKFASNKVDGNKLLLNEINHIDSDIYCQILCTSPFLEINSIIEGINKLIDPSNTFDSVIAGTFEKLYTWEKNKSSYSLQDIPNSIDLDNTFIESMGLYIIDKLTAKRLKRRIGDNPFKLEINKIEAVDVNYEKDLFLANLISSGLREQENSKLRILSKILSSGLISDVLDELGFKDNFINHKLHHNIPNKKLFGRAKTLSLRNINPNEDVDKIYESHNIYENIKLNDLLIVDNKTDYSFFGEINSSFAIRSGASGAIIFGPTRDINATKALDFPVYYKTLCSKDIRGRGSLKSFNKSIIIDNVKIEPNQLVFIDHEGLAVIPFHIEDEVIKRSTNKISSENLIISGITEGLNNSKLMSKFGYF